MVGASYIGHKWSHTYQWEIRRNSSKSLTVVTGSGSGQTFSTWRPDEIGSYIQAHRLRGITFYPQSGVRATLKFESSGAAWAFIYTNRAGIRYKFEIPSSITTSPDRYSLLRLTEISDPNGNRLKLHYEQGPEQNFSHRPRLVAVEDSQGRILKFYYELTINDVDYPRNITKIEFGLGTKTALTTVYQAVKHTYSRHKVGPPRYVSYLLTSVAHQLGSGDPRGTEVKTQYEYYLSRDNYNDRVFRFGYLSAVVSPLGYRTEFNIFGGEVIHVRVRDVPPDDNTEGAVVNER